MSIWKADLTTEDGALGAAQMGGYACFVGAVLSGVSVAMMTGFSLNWGNDAQALSVAILGVAEILIFAIAGFQLNVGKGRFSGTAAILLLVIELVIKATLRASLIAFFINGLLLITTINGVRGAFALRAGKFDEYIPEEAAS